jgi:hypothetical protein
MRTFKGSFRLIPMNEMLQKNKDETEKLGAEKTLSLHISHRDFGVRRGMTEPQPTNENETAVYYGALSFV